MKTHGRKALILPLLLGVLILSACASTPDAQGTQSTGAQSAGARNLTPQVSQPAGQTEAPAQNTAVTPAPASPLPEATLSPTAAQPTPTDAAPAPASVTELPDPSGYIWAPLVNGLERPLDLADPADGSNRLLIVEKAGRIRVLQDGSLLPDPFLDIRDRVGLSGNERGLLGIALHPKYSENGYFYLNYTDLNGNTVIARFTVTADPNRADPASEKTILTYDQPYANHNGGVLAFGPDGYLYIGAGDGGSANDPLGNGQSLDTLLGKLLRIDVDGGDPYAIPADNPFASGGGRLEIWAYGLRNPWRISFDRLTGDLYIADVGQGAVEEIDFQPANAAGGLNYGWKYKEGSLDANGGPPAGFDAVGPVAEYTHADGCSVTGGFVYRGEDLPAFQGVYLYADYCSGKLWGLLRGARDAWQNRELFQLTGVSPTSFGQDSRGELYIIGDNGGVYRLQQQ